MKRGFEMISRLLKETVMSAGAVRQQDNSISAFSSKLHLETP